MPAGSTRKTWISCNFFRFLLSKSDGFVIFNGASQKFAIFSENLDFSVPPRNFSSNQGGQSIRQTKGYPTRALIFFEFFPPFYQEMPKYGSKHCFWSRKQQMWTLKCLETKIHPTSPRHLYSKRDIGIFYFLIIIKGCPYSTCVFVWLTFGQFVKHCFCCFQNIFGSQANVWFCKLGVSVLFCFFYCWPYILVWACLHWVISFIFGSLRSLIYLRDFCFDFSVLEGSIFRFFASPPLMVSFFEFKLPPGKHHIH